MQKLNYSKIPVYQGTKTNVIGFIKVKNLLKLNLNTPKKIKDSEILCEIIKVNENNNLLSIIDTLKSKKINFAAVVGEEGKCKGIITLRQIFEKITLKEFQDNDVRTGFNWNRPGGMEVIEAREQD